MGAAVPVIVALVDDNERFRHQLVERLRFVPGLTVQLQAGSAEVFFRHLVAVEPKPDVALVDIGLPGISGIAVADRLTREYPGIGVLMFTVFEEPDTVLAAIHAGASGYLLKDTPSEEIARGIFEVQEGGVPLSRSIAQKVLGLMGRVPSPASAGDPDRESLSAREVELLERIVRGDTEVVIADRLGISPHTVRTHVKNIYRKLRVRTRAGAVRLALENHLLDRPHSLPKTQAP
jgi:DNA-binding NarL/FixJ family response regulator